MIFGFTEAQIATFGLSVGLGCLILYIFFIIWKIARDSKAGRLGTAIMFLALGLGVFVFVLKEIILWWLNR